MSVILSRSQCVNVMPLHITDSPCCYISCCDASAVSASNKICLFLTEDHYYYNGATRKGPLITLI